MKPSQGGQFVILAVLTIFTVQASADILDLTTAGASGTLNGATFEQVAPQSSGTGVFGTFVRVQHNGTESGYNTDGDLEFDTKAGSHTHSLLLADVPIVNIGGTDYREFRLDINEPTGQDKEFLSLDELLIHLEATGDLTGYPANFSAPIYDLDTGGDNSILLDASLNPGSGKGDMRALIPNSLFVGGPFVYLFSEFGLADPSEGGFEEWAVLEGDGVIIPSPGAFVLGIIGLGVIAAGKQKLPTAV